jgi:RNA recognition motif-containing protein
LFVAGLPFSTTSEELKSLFEQVGVVGSTNIIMDRETNRSRGFGFVEMETAEMASAAVAKFDGSEYGGRKIIVNIARPQEKKEFSRNDNRGGFAKKDFGRREGGRGSFGRNDDRRGGGNKW